jgi:stearoyl-CoA desaturase (delta-9 desaturase)
MKNLFNVNNLKNLQVLTLLAYLVAFVSFFIVSFSLPMLLLTTIMYFLVFGIGVSMTLHRGLAHSALRLHPVIEMLGKFFASVGGTGSPISWVLVHKAHHKYSDTDKDPHSAKDVLKYLIGKYPNVSTQGIRKLAQSKFSKFLHRYYYLVIGAYGACWLSLGFDFFCYGFVYPMVLNMVAGHLVNWYTHSDYIFNYRLHNTKDTSQNNVVIGLLTWGEGFHNTHHKFPARANFGMKVWEIDITFGAIRLLETVKLAKVRLTR